MKHTGKVFRALLGAGLTLILVFTLLDHALAQTCVPPSGLVSWWPSDGNANDIISGNNGTLQGGTTFSPGASMQAFTLNGVDGFVQLNNSLYNPFPATGFTYDFWINPFDTPAGRSRSIVTNHQASGNWWNGISLVDGRVELILQNINTFQTFSWTTAGALTPNTWYHVAAVYENLGNQATDGKIYLDGIQLEVVTTGSGYSASFIPGHNPSNPVGFAIGRLLEDVPNAYFNGLIDEMAFYDRVLTDAEIAAIFNAGSAGKCTNLPPVALCRNVTVNTTTGACTAPVSVNNGSFDPDGGIVAFAQSPAGPYNKGTTNVTLSVADDEGSTASCSGTVTVVDNQPPALTCPAPQVVDSTGPSGATVSFSPTVSDNCDGAVVISCSPASGSTFPVGSTSVSCSATDGSGNTNSCGFSVTVLSPAQMTSNLITAVASLNFQQGSNLLQNTLRQINSGKPRPACNQVSAFINQVQAQSGKQLTAATASQLTASANRIRAALGCS